METKFSDGDWRYSKEHKCVTTSRFGIVEGSKEICKVNSYKPKHEYNGILLATSPELVHKLDATNKYLKSLIDNKCIKGVGTIQTVRSMIRSNNLAISKATK